MPRDKSGTHDRLAPIVKAEFMEWGYEKASVNRIAERAGMSPAGLYKHYAGKKDMFASLVEETVAAFDAFCGETQRAMSADFAGADPFGDAWMDALLDFLYAHYDAFFLLVCRSAGSGYQGFEERLIEREAESCKAFAAQMNAGSAVTDGQWHLVASVYVHAVADIFRRGYRREQARAHMRFLQAVLFPGWKSLFEQ